MGDLPGLGAPVTWVSVWGVTRETDRRKRGPETRCSRGDLSEGVGPDVSGPARVHYVRNVV